MSPSLGEPWPPSASWFNEAVIRNSHRQLRGSRENVVTASNLPGKLYLIRTLQQVHIRNGFFRDHLPAMLGSFAIWGLSNEVLPDSLDSPNSSTSRPRGDPEIGRPNWCTQSKPNRNSVAFCEPLLKVFNFQWFHGKPIS